MISYIENGDILIAMDSPIAPIMNQNQAIAHLIQTADYGMIYRRGDKGHVIYHAALGEHQSGVRGHLFSKVIKNSELGDCYVLRLKMKS